jgi:hypothetical protein
MFHELLQAHAIDADDGDLGTGENPVHEHKQENHPELGDHAKIRDSRSKATQPRRARAGLGAARGRESRPNHGLCRPRP